MIISLLLHPNNYFKHNHKLLEENKDDQEKNGKPVSRGSF